MNKTLPHNLDGIPVTWRDTPFSDNLRFIKVQKRMTIAEVAALLPAEIANRPFATVNDVMIPRDKWHLVRLKEPTSRNPIIVTFPSALQGGGGGGVKRTIGAIAGIAVLLASIVVAPYIASAIAPSLTSAFGISAATTLTLTQATLSIGGALLISALTPPPTAASANQNVPDFQQPNASALSGNTLDPGGAVPRVCGTLKVFPPFGVPPLQTVVGDDMYVEAAYIMAGPHRWEDIRIDDVPLDQIPDFEYETREGFVSDDALTLVTKQSKTNSTAVALSEPKTNTGANLTRQYLNQTTPDIPVWHPMRYVNAPDEAWVCLQWPTGLLDQNSLLQTLLRPLRVRFKPVDSDTWVNCPEIWFASQKNAGFSKDIRFIWETAPTLPTAPNNNGPVYAFAWTQMRVETFIGSATNTYLAFDGSMTTAPFGSEDTTPVWFGGSFEVARNVHYAFFRPKTVTGVPSTPLLTVNLRGSNTLPTSGSDGALLGQVTGIPPGSGNVEYSIASTDTTSTWKYIWLEFIPSGSVTYVITDIYFLGSGDYAWQADAYFRNGTAITNRVMYDSTNGSLKNIALYADRVEIYLDPATYPKGDYDIEIKGGAPIRSSLFNIASYSSGSQATNANGENLRYDFFQPMKVSGVKVVPQDVNGLYFSASRVRTVHIWDEAPIVGHDFAILAVRAKNQQLGQVSAMLSGYTYDWDGSGWNTLTITSNPAPHVIDCLTGTMNADPIPMEIIENDDFVEWRQQCINKNYQVNAVVQDQTVVDVCNILTGCGYGRLRPAEKWGIYMDRDRSAEGPVTIYSHRNMNNFHWDKAFPRLPDGFRARFTDKDNNYNETELIILRSGVTDTGRYEDMRYEGLITSAEVTQRANFDLNQLVARPVIYTGTTNFQHIYNRRGDLVALQVDVLDKLGGSSYITEVIVDDDDKVQGLKLYGSIPIETGEQWGVAIRLLNGSLMIKQIIDPGSSDDYREVYFTTPFDDPGEDILGAQCLVASGSIGQEYRRVIIQTITPKEDTAEIQFVDEAPQLFGGQTARQMIRQLGLDDSLLLCLDAGDGASYTSGQLWLDTGGDEVDFIFGTSTLT